MRRGVPAVESSNQTSDMRMRAHRITTGLPAAFPAGTVLPGRAGQSEEEIPRRIPDLFVHPTGESGIHDGGRNAPQRCAGKSANRRNDEPSDHTDEQPTGLHSEHCCSPSRPIGNSGLDAALDNARILWCTLRARSRDGRGSMEDDQQHRCIMVCNATHGGPSRRRHLFHLGISSRTPPSRSNPCQ